MKYNVVFYSVIEERFDHVEQDIEESKNTNKIIISSKRIKTKILRIVDDM